MQAPEVYWVMIVSEIVPYTTSYSNILMLGTLGVIKRLIKHRPLKCGDRKKKNLLYRDRTCKCTDNVSTRST